MKRADLISACKSWDLVLRYNQIINIKVYKIDIRYRTDIASTHTSQNLQFRYNMKKCFSNSLDFHGNEHRLSRGSLGKKYTCLVGQDNCPNVPSTTYMTIWQVPFKFQARDFLVLELKILWCLCTLGIKNFLKIS